MERISHFYFHPVGHSRLVRREPEYLHDDDDKLQCHEERVAPLTATVEFSISISAAPRCSFSFSLLHESWPHSGSLQSSSLSLSLSLPLELETHPKTNPFEYEYAAVDAAPSSASSCEHSEMPAT